MICNFVLALVLAANPAPVPTAQSLPRIALHLPRAVVRVQVADTDEQRARGLMGVAHLPRRTGMLFVFETDEPVAFWMKDTLVPLDMVFISAQGIVRQVYANVPVVPASMADGDIPLEQARAKYVIELPAGEAPADGLHAGARVLGLPR